MIRSELEKKNRKRQKRLKVKQRRYLFSLKYNRESRMYARKQQEQIVKLALKCKCIPQNLVKQVEKEVNEIEDLKRQIKEIVADS